MVPRTPGQVEWTFGEASQLSRMGEIVTPRQAINVADLTQSTLGGSMSWTRATVTLTQKVDEVDFTP